MFAFFDVDDTLVRLKTMFSFQDYYLRHSGRLARLLGPLRAARFDARCRRFRASGRSREDLNRMYYRTFRGRRPAMVAALARRWFDHVSRSAEDFYVPAVLEALRAHQSAGVEIVFVSGSMVEILQPLAEALGVRHTLATRVVVASGRYTGEITPPQTIGAGKARAVREFLASHSVDGRTCWAYADDITDVPMLATVGHPVVVSGQPTMLEVASLRGWRLLPVRPVG